LLTAGIGRPSATRYNESRSSWLCTVRDRPRAVHSHGRPWIMYVTARFEVTPKTAEQHWIVRAGESEADVTFEEKNFAWVIVLLKLSTDSHKALHSLSAIAESFITVVLPCDFLALSFCVSIIVLCFLFFSVVTFLLDIGWWVKWSHSFVFISVEWWYKQSFSFVIQCVAVW